jgi:hypothetical protein
MKGTKRMGAICSVCLCRSGILVKEEGPQGLRWVCKDLMECLYRWDAFCCLVREEISRWQFVAVHPFCEGFEDYSILRHEGDEKTVLYCPADGRGVNFQTVQKSELPKMTQNLW